MEIPVYHSIPKIATRIKIDVNVELDKRAYIRVSFYEADSEFQPLDTKIIILEGEKYKAWSSDDSYIKDIVFSEFGINVITV